MAQTFYPIDPVEVTPAEWNSWEDVDVSGYLGADAGNATGVILHIVNTNIYELPLGLRKNGSTDDRTGGFSGERHFWAMIGIDSSDIFEAYIGSPTDMDIYLVGYTKSGVTFNTNADDKSFDSTLDWYDIDCSTEAPSAIGLLWEMTSVAAFGFGFRKNGSSDDRYFSQYKHFFVAIIGCDASQICEGYVQDDRTDFFLIGYVTDGCTFNTNATDVSLGSTESWADLSALPSGANMGFIEVATPSKYNFGLRKNGSSENIYQDVNKHLWGIVECDSNQIIEGEIENIEVDFFVVGYSEEAAGWTGKIAGVTDPAKVMGVDVANIASVKGVA